MEATQKEQDDFDSAFAQYSSGQGPAEEKESEVRFEREEEVSDEVEAAPEEEEVREEGGEVYAEAEASDNEVPEEAPQQETVEDRLARLESERDEWRHRYQSDAGRIAALQRKVQEMGTAPQQQRQPSAKDMANAMQNDTAWKEFKETYPEIATVIDKRLNAGFQQVNQIVNQRVGRIEEGDRERQLRDQFMLLQEDHEDYVDVLRGRPFHEWLAQQPQMVQQMAHSAQAQDVSWVLTQHKRDIGATKPAGQQVEPGSRAAAIKSERERKLQQAQAPQNVRTNRPRPVARDDFDGAFAAFAAQQEKRQRGEW